MGRGPKRKATSSSSSESASAAADTTTTTSSSAPATATTVVAATAPPSKKSKTSRSKTTSSNKDKDSNSNSMWSSNTRGGSKKKGKGAAANAPSSSAAACQQSLEHMFAEIADEDDETVASMEGIFTLGEKLGVDALEDIRILVLLFKLGCAANPPGQLTQSEWMKGCGNLGSGAGGHGGGSSPSVDSWESLQTQVLPGLDTGFMDVAEFRDFYKFCFQFNRVGTHRTLDKDLVVALLPMVLKGRLPVSSTSADSNDNRLDTFLEFLEKGDDQQLYSRITLDQWTSFLDFCLEVPNLENYDESTSAWPVLIDEYVEYVEAKSSKN